MKANVVKHLKNRKVKNMQQKSKKVEFEAVVRNHPSTLGGLQYGQITSTKLAKLIGKKVRVIVEEKT
jgi:hypothetical protein